LLSRVKSLVFLQDINRVQASLPDALRSGLPAKGYFWLGLFLLAALIAQQSTGWQWTMLTGLQDNNTYKLVTGFGLLACVLYQWRFSLKRAEGEKRNAATMMSRHKLFGALVPLAFFSHSQTLGYGYLEILSLTLLLAFLTGLFNFQIGQIHTPWYRPVWISAHVGLSMALLLLIGYHIYINYAFK
jgi:hypothetical protein